MGFLRSKGFSTDRHGPNHFGREERVLAARSDSRKGNLTARVANVSAALPPTLLALIDKYAPRITY